MRVLFIIDPIESLNAYKDTSVAMMQALQTRGHQLEYGLVSGLSVRPEGVVVQASALRLRDGADLHRPDWFEASAPQERSIRDFDAVLMRKDPPFDLNYFYATHLLSEAEREGVLVVNSGHALRDTPEKLAILRLTDDIPETLVSSEAVLIAEFIHTHGDTVIKPLDGMGGRGICRLRPDDVNLNAIVELLTDYGHTPVMLQRFISKIDEGDKRVLIIDGEVVPFCLARIPRPGETRGNLAAGGRGVTQPLSDSDRALAERVATAFTSQGLFLMGIDIIGDRLTEINVTSPTCFVEITQDSGWPVAEVFAQALERRVQARAAA